MAKLDTYTPDSATGQQFQRLGRSAPTPLGAAGDMTTDDTTPVATALSALSPHEVLRLPERYAVTAFDNHLGAEFEGPGFARLTSGALRGIQALRSPRYGFGQELLHAFHNKLYNHQAHTVLMSGDSTTASFDVGLIPAIAAKLKLSTCSFVQRGYSGMSTHGWYTGGYHLSDLSTYTPHLMVLRWGINGPTDSRTAAQEIADLRSGLAGIRGATGGDLKSLSIVVCTPTVTTDTTQGRDEAYHEQLANGFRQAAIDYNCAFLDLYSIFPNARGGSYATGNAAAGLWYDDPFSDGRAVHPTALHNYRVAQVIGDFIYGPMQLAGYFGQTLADIVAPDEAVHTAAATDDPSTFPVGVSIYRTDGTFPLNAFATTFKSYSAFAMQINWGYSSETYQVRFGSTSAWGSWLEIGSNKLTTTTATPASGFSLPGADDLSYSMLPVSNTIVTTDGYLSASSIQITHYQVIATIEPAKVDWTHCTLLLLGTDWETIPGAVMSDGTVKALANSVQTNISRVYVKADYRRA